MSNESIPKVGTRSSMRLSEYSDDELIEEIKHRGLKLKVNFEQIEYPKVRVNSIEIGGVTLVPKT